MPGALKTSIKLGAALSAVTTGILLVVETGIELQQTGYRPDVPGITLGVTALAVVVALGVLLTVRYLALNIMRGQGWQLVLRGKPASRSTSAILGLSWGLFWRLLILLIPFQALLIVLVWLFLPIGVLGETVAGLLLWLYIFGLYALTGSLAWLWLLRFAYGRYRYQASI